MKKYIVILSVLFLVACSAKLVTPTEADAERGSKRYPNYTLKELHQGKATYEQYCGDCHKLKRPSSESEKEWKEIVPIMVGKVNKKAGFNAISPQTQESLLKYLITMGSK